jgi:hypothetical protein
VGRGSGAPAVVKASQGSLRADPEADSVPLPASGPGPPPLSHLTIDLGLEGLDLLAHQEVRHLHLVDRKDVQKGVGELAGAVVEGQRVLVGLHALEEVGRGLARPAVRGAVPARLLGTKRCGARGRDNLSWMTVCCMASFPHPTTHPTTHPTPPPTPPSNPVRHLPQSLSDRPLFPNYNPSNALMVLVPLLPVPHLSNQQVGRLTHVVATHVAVAASSGRGADRRRGRRRVAGSVPGLAPGATEVRTYVTVPERGRGPGGGVWGVRASLSAGACILHASLGLSPAIKGLVFAPRGQPQCSASGRSRRSRRTDLPPL